MIITSDAQQRTDSIYHILAQNIKSPLPIVIVSWVENFVFNKSLLPLRDYLLIDMCEYGWNYKIETTHVWGVNTDKKGYGDGRYVGEEWDKFDLWVKNSPPKLYFKRELLKEDATKTLQPIEYITSLNNYPAQSKEQFNSRPINCFSYWGRSNECRLRIHGETWLHSFKKGFQVCDNIYYINQYMSEEQGEKWISLWIPHWARVDISNLISVNNLSKLSLSWPGAGFKCFRSAESPINSVMVMHKNNFAWAYDWNETNCILVEPGKEIEGIEAALERGDLYDIYLKGVENCNKYRVENYISNYIQPLIQSVV